MSAMEATHMRDTNTKTIVGLLGLWVLFGQLGGIPSPGPAQNILWAISSVGMLLASPMLAIRFARQGKDLIAAGHVLLTVAALMLYAGGPISTPGGQTSFSSSILFYAPALLAIGSGPGHPLFSRICGALTAVFFSVHGTMALAGATLNQEAKLVSVGGYLFMTAAVVGWMVGLWRAPKQSAEGTNPSPAW
jgi:hypothetical protein